MIPTLPARQTVGNCRIATAARANEGSRRTLDGGTGPVYHRGSQIMDNKSMSRGWESKDVESQMEEAALRRAAPKPTPPTPEQLRIESERESLELSRRRVLGDLKAATNPRRREQLESALRHLEQKLAAL
jgi:hypothetical protein